MIGAGDRLVYYSITRNNKKNSTMQRCARARRAHSIITCTYFM